MKEINQEELKTIQLDILKSVADYCEANGLIYFLGYGTLLGAVRHKGYIPWDDDIDILMPRPSYEKLLKGFNNNSKTIKAIDFSLNPDYPLPFAKVYDCRTMLSEDFYKDKPTYGIYIDIFPLDGFRNLSNVKKIVRLNKYLNSKKALIDGKRSFAKNVIIGIGKILLMFTSKSKIINKMQRIAAEVPYEKSDKICSMFSPYSVKEVCDKTLLEETIMGEFEGFEFRIPKNYDTYLRMIYCDYLKLPPVEKRVAHHTFTAWWI